MVSGGIAFNLKGWALMLEMGVVCLAVAAIFLLPPPASATPRDIAVNNELAVGAGSFGAGFIAFGIWLRKRRPAS
jgi:hypothetical protein